MVESTINFEDVLKTFTEGMKSEFSKLKTNLPDQQMRKNEERMPEMLALKGKLAELIE